MKKKEHLPQKEFQLDSTNPITQNMVIDFLRKEGIPVYEGTTEYDPSYPILFWGGENITQSRAEKDKKYSVEEFIDQFFTNYETVNVGKYSTIIDNGYEIEVGCQTISFETVEQVYNEMKKLRD